MEKKQRQMPESASPLWALFFRDVRHQPGGLHGDLSVQIDHSYGLRDFGPNGAYAIA